MFRDLCATGYCLFHNAIELFLTNKLTVPQNLARDQSLCPEEIFIPVIIDG